MVGVLRIARLLAVAGFVSAQNTEVEDCGNPPTVHVINVGHQTNQFEPNCISANPGDVVQFNFYRQNHSVIESLCGWPCVPKAAVVPGEDHFYSGFFPIDSAGTVRSWNLTINDTSPIFYYSGAPGSCADSGMVGVINADCTTGLKAQLALAKTESYMLEPGEPLCAEASASLRSQANQMTCAPTRNPTTPTTPIPIPIISTTASSTSAVSSPDSSSAPTGPLSFSQSLTPSSINTPNPQSGTSSTTTSDTTTSSDGLVVSSRSPTSTTATATTVAAVPAGSSTIPALSGQGVPQRNKSSDLSGGAIAGIVVGIVLALALAGAILWFCCCGRRRQTPGMSAQGPPPNVPDPEPGLPYTPAGPEMSPGAHGLPPVIPMVNPFDTPYASDHESVTQSGVVQSRRSEASETRSSHVLAQPAPSERSNSGSSGFGLLVPLKSSDPQPVPWGPEELHSEKCAVSCRASHLGASHHEAGCVFDEARGVRASSEVVDHEVEVEAESELASEIRYYRASRTSSGSQTVEISSAVRSTEVSEVDRFETLDHISPQLHAPQNIQLQGSKEVVKVEQPGSIELTVPERHEITYPGTPQLDSLEPRYLDGREITFVELPDLGFMGKPELRVGESRELGHAETPGSEISEVRLSQIRGLSYTETPSLERSEIRMSQMRGLSYAGTPSTEISEPRISQTRGLSYVGTPGTEVSESRLSQFWGLSSPSEDMMLETPNTRFSEASGYISSRRSGMQSSERHEFTRVAGSGHMSSETYEILDHDTPESEELGYRFMKVKNGRLSGETSDMRTYNNAKLTESSESRSAATSETKFSRTVEQSFTESSGHELSNSSVLMSSAAVESGERQIGYFHEHGFHVGSEGKGSQMRN